MVASPVVSALALASDSRFELSTCVSVLANLFVDGMFGLGTGEEIERTHSG